MYNEIKHLDWDSDFFKKKIGCINFKQNDNINVLLIEAKNKRYQLIYLFGNKDCYIEDGILSQYNGHLADRKIIYQKKTQPIISLPFHVFEYKENILTPELEQLAYESGNYSRFKLDRNFDDGDFYRMYKIWMEKSVKKQMADNVFVIKENDIIKAMVTMKIDATKGRIGLISVSAATQGKGYGKALLVACEQELINKNITMLEVPTQIDNKQACGFYEKYGFIMHSITNIYHFWL